VLDYGGVPLSAEPIVETVSTGCAPRAASSAGSNAQHAARSAK
jgi:hypothetical protein